MPTLQELKSQAKELNFKAFWNIKKEFKHLPKILTDDEYLKALASGLMHGHTWLIVTTNKRVIFLDRGFFYGLKQIQIPLSKINSISQKQGIVFGEIHIWDGASRTEISNVPKSVVTNFVNNTNLAIEELHQALKQPESGSGSISDELLKLADLKEKGILTEEEFENQKQKLLGK